MLVLTCFCPPVDPTTRDPRFDNQQGGDPFQDTSQSTDPNLGRRDPASDQFDRQDRSIGTGGGHVRDPLGQQGHRDQLRQGGQTGLDSVPYGGGGDRDPRQTGNRTGQVVGGPQERFEPSGNYGTSTGTGPGARPGDYDIHGDGGFGKPTLPERVIGKLPLFPLSLYGIGFDHHFCLQALPRK